MKRRFLLIILGLTAAVAGCQSFAPVNAKHDAQQRWGRMRGRVRLQLAQQQYEAGLFEDAARTATEAITLDPMQADSFTLLIRANLELGKAASAEQALAAARSQGFDDAVFDYLQGVILEQRGDMEAAADMYANAHKRAPDQVDYLVARVECLVALGRTDEALNLLVENANRFDDDGTIPTLTAHIAVLTDDFDRARRRYRQALSVRPESRLVAGELGRLLAEAGRCEEALTVLRPLLDTEGDVEAPGAVRRALAGCHLALGDPTSASEVLIDYAQRHPDDTLAQLLLAKAAIASNDLLTAMRAVDLAQQRGPDCPELWIVRAAVRWKRGNLAAAASDLYDILQNDPEDVEAHCLLAEVLRDQQRVDAARNQFEAALSIDAGCAWAVAGLKALASAQRPAGEEPSPRLTSAKAETTSADTRP